MKRALILGISLALAAPVLAQTNSPRSAIPWLSESLTDPASAAASAIESIDPPGEISVTSLQAPSQDGLGLLSPTQTGFPVDFWGSLSALRARHLILTQPLGGVPEARALFNRILLAETSPPIGAEARPLVLGARLDRLMGIGALDQADALISLAGVSDPELFRRAFDIGLLTDRADKVCATLRETPDLSPTLPARIFCLARRNDWKAAALTLTLGHDLGQIPAPQEELLARFLDPQLFEGIADPPPPDPLTTLDFVLREAVALPRPEGVLPLAFLHVDLAEHAPMRARIEAGERLIRTGAIPPTVLFAAYRTGRPAASGGVWDRAAAVQTLDAALQSGDVRRVERALVDADTRFAAADLRLPFAISFADRLTELTPDGFSRQTHQRIAQLLLLADLDEAALDWRTAPEAPQQRLAFALAGDMDDLPAPARLGTLERAMIHGLTAEEPPSAAAMILLDMINAGQQGEAILRALELVKGGLEADPGDLETALFALRFAGQAAAARRIALETLVLQPEA